MLFVGTSIIHPSTEGVFLLCNILDLLIYSNNSVYIRYSAQKSFDASLEAVHGLLSGEMDETQLMKESGIARTFNQLFFSISSLLTFFHFLLYLSKIITKDN